MQSIEETRVTWAWRPVSSLTIQDMPADSAHSDPIMHSKPSTETVTFAMAHVDIHAELRGTHPSAIFLHGFGGDLSTWDSLWDAMGADFSAIRYDLRGFGRSTCRERVPFKHADDLLAVLDACALEQCDVVGVSMGGGVALNFALDHPERVRCLVLISPALVAWEWSAEWRTLWQAIVDRARQGEMDAARHLWWQHPLFATTRNCAASLSLFESIMRFGGDQWIRDDHQPMLPDLERLHLLQVPTLLLTGSRDFEDFRVIAGFIAAAAGQLQRVELPERGHLLHLEDPEFCAREITAFWARTS